MGIKDSQREMVYEDMLVTILDRLRDGRRYVSESEMKEWEQEILRILPEIVRGK